MPFDSMPLDIGDVVKLKVARDGIATRNGWVQGEFGLEHEPAHCLIGWLLHAVDWDAGEAVRLAIDYLYPALPPGAARNHDTRIESVMQFNDHKATQARVVKLLDDAILLAGK